MVAQLMAPDAAFLDAYTWGNLTWGMSAATVRAALTDRGSRIVADEETATGATLRFLHTSDGAVLEGVARCDAAGLYEVEGAITQAPDTGALPLIVLYVATLQDLATHYGPPDHRAAEAASGHFLTRWPSDDRGRLALECITEGADTGLRFTFARGLEDQSETRAARAQRATRPRRPRAR